MKNKEKIVDIMKQAEAFTQKVPDQSEMKDYLEKASFLNGIVSMLEGIMSDENFLETHECTKFLERTEERILALI